MLNVKLVNAICAGVCFSLFFTHPLKAQSQGSLRWGKPVDAIQMSISATGPGKAGLPKFQVTFRNAGARDTSLYLGMRGGSEPHVDLRFNLNVTDSRGKTRKFKFRGPGFVAGRLDPYIVHLQAGSTYALDVDMYQFWSPDTREWKLNLAPGR